MSKRTQLLVIIFSVLAISSVTSHLIARNCKLMARLGDPMKFNTAAHGRGVMVAAGSSLTFYGIAWSDVAEDMHTELIGLAVPGGSVSEMEVLQRQTPPARCTLIGISAYDINENHISDFRARVVPFWDEVALLWSAHAEWAHAKKILSQYPLKYVRLIFPTTGQSSAIMVRIREVLRKLVHRNEPPPPSEGAVITDKGNGHLDNITDWPKARLYRNIADVRSHGGAEFEFHSTKRESLFRFLRYGAAQGRVVVMVIPESPTYKKEFVTEEVRRRFEEFIADAQKRVPEVLWVRLDQIPELNSDKNYWDLIHLNTYGQDIATKALIAKLAASGIP